MPIRRSAADPPHSETRRRSGLRSSRVASSNIVAITTPFNGKATGWVEFPVLATQVRGWCAHEGNHALRCLGPAGSRIRQARATVTTPTTAKTASSGWNPRQPGHLCRLEGDEPDPCEQRQLAAVL